jgi:hypothetical protein
MKRMVLLILVLLLMIDSAEDGLLGKTKLALPDSSVKASVTSSHHPDSDQNNFRQDMASTDLPQNPNHGDSHSVNLRFLPCLQIIDCCHFSSSGGIPL